jgi:hypothetical protein
MYIFSNMDDINGEINVKLRDSNSFEHTGIQIELIGVICK